MTEKQLVKNNEAGKKEGGMKARAILIRTLILFIVLAAAGAALSDFIDYRKRSYDAAACADIKNLYTECQAYYTDDPSGDCSGTLAQSYGFTPTSGVSASVFSSRPSSASPGEYSPNAGLSQSSSVGPSATAALAKPKTAPADQSSP